MRKLNANFFRINIFIFFLTLVMCVCNHNAYSQCQTEGTLIINEIGYPDIDSRCGYIEFLVIGSSSNPTAPVNLENYIIDDNSSPSFDIENEPRHLRLGPCFSAVPPGTLILIYNPSYASSDVSIVNPDNDGVGLGLIQTSGNCLLGCKASSKTNPGGYKCTSSQPITNIRDYMPIRNYDNMLQVRAPEGNLVHAISWVEDSKYSTSNGTIFFDIDSMERKIVSFNTGEEWTNTSNFSLGDTHTATPGSPNSPANRAFITKIRQGLFSQDFVTSVLVKAQPTVLKDNDGAIQITISGGTPPYFVLISGNTYEHLSEKRWRNAGTYIVEGLPANSYNITIEDNNYCFAPHLISLDNALTVCPGECTTIGDSTGALCKYSWTDGNTSSTQEVCPTETTTYTLTAIDENGDKIELNYTVEVKAAKITPNPAIICPSMTEVTLGCAEQYNSYNWSNGLTTPTITVSQPGTYKITVTDQSNCTLTGTANIYDANNPEQIKSFFIEKKFNENVDVIIENLPGKSSIETNALNASSCLNILANASVYSLEDKEIFNYNEEFKKLCDGGYYDKIFATENENFCLEHIAALSAFNNPAEKVLWAHLYRFGTESIFFLSVRQ